MEIIGVINTCLKVKLTLQIIFRRDYTMSKKVAIVGIGYAKFGSTTPDVSYREMIYEAATRCYEDAGGIHPKDIDAFVATSEDFMEGVSIADEYVPDQLGAVLKPVQSITGDALQTLASAMMHIQTGELDLVAASSFSKASNVLEIENLVSYACDPITIRPLNENPNFIAGLEMNKFLEETDNTKEQCAEVVVKNKTNALNNPYASYGARITKEKVLNSPPQFDPLCELDGSEDQDGAIVVLLASEEKAEEICENPIWVKGIGWATNTPNIESRTEGLGKAVYAELAAKKAYEQAGIQCPRTELSLAEIDDTFSYKELQHIEALKLCSEGKAGDMIEQGVFAKNGELPVNVSGGNLGFGHMHEANGFQKLMEVVLQLRGEAGKRQVENAHTGLAFAWRNIPTATGAAAVLSNNRY